MRGMGELNRIACQWKQRQLKPRYAGTRCILKINANSYRKREVQRIWNYVLIYLIYKVCQFLIFKTSDLDNLVCIINECFTIDFSYKCHCTPVLCRKVIRVIGYRTLFPQKPGPMPNFFRHKYYKLRILNLGLFKGPQKQERKNDHKLKCVTINKSDDKKTITRRVEDSAVDY